MDKFDKLLKEVWGMTTPTILRFLNSYVSKIPEDQRYLEVGCFQGASLIGALLGNKTRGVGVDNFSQFNKDNNKKILQRNLDNHPHVSKRVVIFEMDFHDFFATYAPPVGFYYYDGDHGAEPGYEGMFLGYKILKPGGYMMVDDVNWGQVKESIDKMKQTTDIIEIERHETTPTQEKPFDEIWWNGIALFQKPKLNETQHSAKS